VAVAVGHPATHCGGLLVVGQEAAAVQIELQRQALWLSPLVIKTDFQSIKHVLLLAQLLLYYDCSLSLGQCHVLPYPCCSMHALLYCEICIINLNGQLAGWLAGWCWWWCASGNYRGLHVSVG